MSGKRGNNEGSVYQEKTGVHKGKWVAAVTFRDAMGKLCRKRARADTRAEASIKLTQLRHDIDQGVPLATGQQTVKQYLSQWIEYSAPEGLKPNTLRTYTGHVHRHIIPTIGDRQLSKLNFQDVQELQRKLAAKGLQPATVVYCRKVLRKALQQAVRGGLLVRNPVDLVDAPRIPREEIHPFTAEQAQSFIKAVKDTRLGALYTIAAILGLRKGEILALRWTDIDLDSATLQVRATLTVLQGSFQLTTPKTPKSIRRIHLPAVVVSALQAHREEQERERQLRELRWQDTNLVFTTSVGTPISPRNLSRSFDALLPRLGLPSIRFHDLRHTAASVMIANGVPIKLVSEILGHSSIAITLQVYGHIYDEQRRDAANKLDELYGMQDSKDGNDRQDKQDEEQ